MKKATFHKSTKLQVRVDADELADIVLKSHLYTKGHLSNFIRLACASYKPVQKVKVGK